MPKQKKVVSKKSKKSAKVKTVSVSRPVRGISANKVSAVCSQNDPFCVHAKGAQMLSSGMFRTVPFSIHRRSVMSSDANGNGSYLFVPNYANNCLFPASTISPAQVATFTTTAVSSNPDVEAVRFVTGGIIVRSICSPNSAQGMVRIRTFAIRAGTSLSNIDMGTYSCAESLDIPINNCKEVAVAHKVTDDRHESLLSSADILTAGTDVSFYRAMGMTVILVSVTGAQATTPVLDFEILYNLELLPSDSDPLMVSFGKISPPLPADVAAANASISASAKSISKSGVADFGRTIARHAVQALAGAVVTAVSKSPYAGFSTAVMLGD